MKPKRETGPINMRIHASQRYWLRKYALETGRTLNNAANYLVSEGLKAHFDREKQQ